MEWFWSFIAWLGGFFESSDVGEWHDPRPCRNCGMRVFYAVDNGGELQLKCATCRKDEP